MVTVLERLEGDEVMKWKNHSVASVWPKEDERTESRRQYKWGRGRERWRDRESQGGPAQHGAQCWARTQETWDRSLSQNQVRCLPSWATPGALKQSASVLSEFAFPGSVQMEAPCLLQGAVVKHTRQESELLKLSVPFRPWSAVKMPTLGRDDLTILYVLARLS